VTFRERVSALPVSGNRSRVPSGPGTPCPGVRRRRDPWRPPRVRPRFPPAVTKPRAWAISRLRGLSLESSPGQTLRRCERPLPFGTSCQYAGGVPSEGPHPYCISLTGRGTPADMPTARHLNRSGSGRRAAASAREPSLSARATSCLLDPAVLQERLGLSAKAGALKSHPQRASR
jgi:hypothetical protein